ncbi:hypothetical protein D1007_22437 [Hordeum vulgare]|nr:hypothetical protein D1007_22437 [Hordeum vulgare]
MSRIQHHIKPLQGRWLSKATRTVLINSSLSRLLIFVMSFYSLHETLHHDTAKYESSFYWDGEDDKQKYHMLDHWAGESPFATRFPGLFTIVVEARTSVEVALQDLGRLAFHRPFGPPELAVWDEMLQCIALSSPDIDSSMDHMSWCLEPSGRFSTRSLYRAIIPSSAPVALTSVWDIRLPLKIGIFLWQ